MATPLSAAAMLSALRAEGVNIREHSGWRTRNRNAVGAWGPVEGVMIHHTAGVNSLGICVGGVPGLPGPLCHAHLAKNGTTTLVGHGRANHSGSIAQNAYNSVLNASMTKPSPGADAVDGNRRLYGIEIENLGNGRDPYPAVQYDQAVRWAAAICRAHGWSAGRIIGHGEATRRKIDPSFDMNKFRRDVAARLGANAAPDPTPKDDEMPEREYYTTSGYTRDLRPGDWTTLNFNRRQVGNSMTSKAAEPSVVFGPCFWTGHFGVTIEGLERGTEVQMRFGLYRPASGGGFERYSSTPLHSPVQASGNGHFVYGWTTYMTHRARCEVKVLQDKPTRATAARCEILYWK